MLRCYIEGKNISAYGVETRYPISDGAIFTENYNEELDSGTILIQQLDSKIEIEPYDVVVIENYDNGILYKDRRLCVDTYICTQTSLNPPLYKYEISLFSETKILEGFILPNLKITKKKTGTPRKVWYYLNLYNDLYGPKTAIDGSSIIETENNNKFHFSSNSGTKFNVDCPELQWNQPTFREVLNDLMMVCDCIPTLNNNVIGYIDISQVDNTTPDISGINYIQTSQSSDDYVSEIKMNLVNVANNDNTDTKSTSLIEKIGFRNDESYLLTTESMLLQTQLPIWKVFRLRVLFPTAFRINYLKVPLDGGQSETMYADIPAVDLQYDLTPYLLEQKEWQTKDVYYGAWGSTTELSSTYRNTCLYYIRGQKNIFNFNNKYETDFLFIHNDEYVLELIIDLWPDLKDEWVNQWIDLMNQSDPDHYRYDLLSYTSTPGFMNWKQLEFWLEYEPIDDCVFTASKSPIQKKHRAVVDNQTNSYIDIDRQGLLEYMKANRLGNEMDLINGRYYVDETDIPDLAQKINNKIIFRKQISCYNNYVDVNYYATANYVLKDYFTGVKSKLRSWRVLTGGEALIRHDLIKFYINVTTMNDYVALNGFRKIPVYGTIDDYINNFKYCAIQLNENVIDVNYIDPSKRIPNINSLYNRQTRYPQDDDDQHPVYYDTNGFLMEFSKHVINDKSIIFTLGFPDNYYYTNYVSYYEGTGGAEQKGIAYTDNNGEVYGGFICFYNNYKGTPFYSASNEVDRALKPMINMGMTPGGTDGLQLSSEDLVCKIPFRVSKDNGEILKISIQFEINTQANDMFMGWSDNEDE